MYRLYLFIGFFLLSGSIHLSNAQDFRFALLSDLHISQKAPVAGEDLNKAVEQINRTPELSFVIVSGDITENGDRQSLLQAKAILDRLQIPYHITSGNHDTKWTESAFTDFANIFGSDYFRFEYHGFLFLGFNTGPVVRMAEGHVAPQDINALSRDLKKWGKKKPVIITTHYPLQKGDVDNWYEVTDLLQQYNIKAILGGHYHSNSLTYYDGIPAFINRSTLRANGPVGGYTVFTVSSDSIIAYNQMTDNVGPTYRGGYSLHTEYVEKNRSYERPDYSLNHSYSLVSEAWRTQLGAAIYASPVVANNAVYIGDDKGYLNCLNMKNGKVIWRYQTGNRIVATAAVSEGRVVFGSADKNIYCLDTNGRLIWKIEAKEAVMGVPLIADGVVYIGASDHCFRAIDLYSGKIIWEYTDIHGYIESRPLLYKGNVVFGAWDNYLYALSAGEGKLLWKWNENGQRMHFSPAAVWSVAAHGKVFITAPDRAMTAIDVQNGHTVWRTKQSTVRETIGLSEDSSRVFSKTMRDSLVCFSAQNNRVEKLWATYIGYGYEFAPSMPQEKDGVIYGSTMTGELFAVDSYTGHLIWRRKVANSLVNTVFPLSGKRCIYSCSDGSVALLVTEKQ
ncbi:MAG: PQQ-binding-like beta-propeller repeat protein [Bacteroidales bacterium]|jgi:outer membrane protein assembly factor BamB|nr:PQQ-binding-like beta-propeller repeat protein [Bacteroidales bacterium]